MIAIRPFRFGVIAYDAKSEEPLTFSGSCYTVNKLDGFPKPVQRPHLPLLVGGAGKRLLTLAAREASIVSIGAKAQGDGSGLDVTDTMPAATRQKVEWIRWAAGERFNLLELNVIIYAVVVTEDRRHIAQQLADCFKTTDERVLTIPHCLIGTLDQISEVCRYVVSSTVSHILQCLMSIARNSRQL